MGICGPSAEEEEAAYFERLEREREERKEAAAAEEAAEAKAFEESAIQLEIEPDEGKSFTASAHGLETADKLLKRLAHTLFGWPPLDYQWHQMIGGDMKGLSLEFNGMAVGEYTVLQDSGIKEGVTVRLLGVAKLPLIRTDDDMRTAVNAWCDDPVAAEAEYGHISQWDTKRVTNFMDLFRNKSEFNEDLSRWDLSSCREMNGIFDGASSMKEMPGWYTSFYSKYECED